jgi:hypothetical protein
LNNSHTITTGSADAVQFVQKKLKEHADAQESASKWCITESIWVIKVVVMKT